MIKSMTGFGRGEATSLLGKVTVELRSVNHRYLDMNIRMPRKFNALEANVRNEIKKCVYRGKLDVYINYENYSEDNVSIQYNSTVAGEYLTYLKQMEEQFGLTQDITTSKLAAMPEVFVMSQAEEDEEELWSLLKTALDSALDGFIAQRIAEGEELKTDLLGKLDRITELVNQVEEKYPLILEGYKSRLTQKMEEIFADKGIDESRIVAEVVIYADKCCVDEETVRLKSHVLQVAKAMDADSDVGKKLDFLVQEMNREANTMLSKSTNINMTDIGIELKTGIEKIREQVQNIE